MFTSQKMFTILPLLGYQFDPKLMIKIGSTNETKQSRCKNATHTDVPPIEENEN